MKALVTGGDGFIGRHLCPELEQRGYEVEVLDHRRTRYHDLRRPGVFGRFLRASRPDVVIHLAAEVGRLHCEDVPILTAQQNAGVTAHVAKACAEEQIRLAYASTSEVYGGGERIYTEDSPCNPINLYGLSKLWGEQACRLYAPPGLTIFRLSMPYGPGGPATNLGYHAAIQAFLWLAKNRQPITVHKGAERSWCYISDTVRGMAMVLEKSEGTYNIGRVDPVSMLNVAAYACGLTGAHPDALIEEVDAPERQSAVKRLADTKLRWLGWKPGVDLIDGMKRTLEAM